jgi:hypothetical protein
MAEKYAEAKRGLGKISRRARQDAEKASGKDFTQIHGDTKQNHG